MVSWTVLMLVAVSRRSARSAGYAGPRRRPQVDRRGCDRRVTQVVTYGGQRCAAGQRVCCVRMPQPVRRRALQFASECRVVDLDDVGGGVEEAAQHLPLARCGDAAGLVQLAEQRNVRRPSCWNNSS